MKADDFESIRVDFHDIRQVFYDPKDFTFNDEYEECAARNIVWGTIAFSGIPTGLSEEQYEEAYDGDNDNIVLIGRITGCLILFGKIMNEGFEPRNLGDWRWKCLKSVEIRSIGELKSSRRYAIR